MSKLFIISDTHFCHDNIIRYCDRPFVNSTEMNLVMISNWNKVVQPEDWVIHGGDFAFGRGSTLNRVIDIRQQLNGNIVLCKGNHDRIIKPNKWLELVHMQAYLQNHLDHFIINDSYVIVYLKDETCKNLKTGEWWNKKIIYISHKPLVGQTATPYFYGHIHNNSKEQEEMYKPGINMCVEKINYTPVFLGEL